jgi:hypothetical protein
MKVWRGGEQKNKFESSYVSGSLRLRLKFWCLSLTSNLILARIFTLVLTLLQLYENGIL